MFTVGCIQSQSCHTNCCPAGVATQHALVVPDKAERVWHFHANIVKAFSEMLASAGLTHPGQITPDHMLRRISATEIKHYNDIYFYLAPGALLKEQIDSEFYARMWRMATPHSFDSQAVALA